MPDQPLDRIRDAASIVLIRDPGDTPAVLLGRRGERAAFMPSKFVFPGGAVDAADAAVPVAGQLSAQCRARLAHDPSSPVAPEALAVAAIRELWEEAGLRLAAPGTEDIAPLWHGFATGGALPNPAALTYFFRAITPPGRPRRFDARFFLADCASVLGDPEDFSAASDELSDLGWVPLSEAQAMDLPQIQQGVLRAVERLIPDLMPPARVPFFNNRVSPGELSYLE